MRAWQCDDARPVPKLFLREVIQPVPKLGELLIQIHAAGITAGELTWYPTTHTRTGSDRSHAIPGHDFSGVVVAAGSGADIPVGQAIYGMNDWFAEGATAEFCCAPASAVAPKPARLTHAEAASIPIAALTAWQGLFDRAQLQRGERVLIHGGSGAVGVLAIQLARWQGAHVITTASARHRELLMSLGANQVVDYRTERFEDAAGPVDVVFDGVGGETLQRSWSLLGPNSHLVTIASSSEVEQDERTKRAFFIVEPKGEQLRTMTALVESGQLKPVLDSVVPFDQAGAAYAGYRARSGPGKTVIEIPSN